MSKTGPTLVPVKCALCNSPEFVHLHKIRGMSIVSCCHCGCIYTNPRAIWDYADPASQVDPAYYLRHYWPARLRSASKIWDQLPEYRVKGTLLDLGCGFGFFLKEAQRQGWQARGVELNPGQASWARQHLALDVESDLASADLQPGSFDVITLWDVIEHIGDPRTFLKRCHSLLRPGGALLLKTPNAEGLLQEGPWWLKPLLPAYRQLVYPANPMEHLYHFTPHYLAQLLEDEDFRVVQSDPCQDWDERIIVGRNMLVAAIRYPLMWIAWRLKLPYEVVVLAESQ